MTWSVGEDSFPQTFGVELICGIVAVDKLDDLLRGHAGVWVTAFLPQVVFLLEAPAVDVAKVLGVDLDEGIEEVGEAVVLGEFLIDEEEVLELVLLEGVVGLGQPGLDALGG